MACAIFPPPIKQIDFACIFSLELRYNTELFCRKYDISCLFYLKKKEQTMVWFKNLMIYRLTKALDWTADSLQTALQQCEYHPCQQSDMSKFGWTNPAWH